MESREAYVKGLIRRRYGRQAKTGAGGRDRALAAGYSEERLCSCPDVAVAGWSGCGALASGINLGNADVVFDLGAGSGLDAFLLAMSARSARVVAVDLTPEALPSLAQAPVNLRAIAGDFDRLPFADSVGDVVVANAAFNLALDMEAAFSEAWRILKPGGRLHICELVREHDLDPELMSDPMAWGASLGGVVREDRLVEIVHGAGFSGIAVRDRWAFPPVAAIRLDAVKPAAAVGVVAV